MGQNIKIVLVFASIIVVLFTVISILLDSNLYIWFDSAVIISITIYHARKLFKK